MKPTTCVFCRKEITEGNIRCDECNKVWWNGHESGCLSIKYEIQDILNTIKNLYSTK